VVPSQVVLGLICWLGHAVLPEPGVIPKLGLHSRLVRHRLVTEIEVVAPHHLDLVCYLQLIADAGASFGELHAVRGYVGRTEPPHGPVRPPQVSLGGRVYRLRLVVLRRTLEILLVCGLNMQGGAGAYLEVGPSRLVLFGLEIHRGPGQAVGYVLCIEGRHVRSPSSFSKLEMGVFGFSRYLVSFLG